ncbi:MAG: hypothetical protein CL393_09580 [Acidiferrobacteraceae bacterium]|jgi:tRNA threonylcarbamoyladenosine modification (KEOPS) complex Cgi121 subunit|nr:hypothetical protein [Acidiferrobacteraceae bacterium]|tara:strand:+ start:2060 stop:2362 length:303 start_codon:yes stop_codon:yes gene_type:complete
MSRVHAFKFLILHTLSKNKSKISSDLYLEIARSLNTRQENERMFLTWLSKGKNKEIMVDEKKFNFYIKSEFDQPTDNKQIDVNENKAKDLVLEIIKQSLQ